MEEIIQEALSKGVEMHSAGAFDLASQLYDSVLKLQPNNADANHNIGLLKLDTGNDLEALPYLHRALEADSTKAQFWLSYVKALIKLERLDEARRILDQAKEGGFEDKPFAQLRRALNSSIESGKNVVLSTTEFEEQNSKPIKEWLAIIDGLEGPQQNNNKVISKIIQGVQEGAYFAQQQCSGINLPSLDRVLTKISGIVRRRQNLKNCQASPGKSMILVSELFIWGGHSRIVEDIVDQTTDEVLVVITDYLDQFSNGKLRLDQVYQRLENVSVVCIPHGSNIEKVFSITNMINLLCPSKLFILLHHDDAVGYVATKSHKVIGLKDFFIHHADHKPTLGASLKYEKHLDTTQEYQQACTDLGCKNCETLPLFVEDRGMKTPKIIDGFMNFSSVGSSNKFTFEGELDHSVRIADCLETISQGRFFHIGPLNESSLVKIKEI